MKLLLEIINNKNIKKRNFEFSTKGGTIGRSNEANWQLEDEFNHISSKHIIIEYKNDLFFIKDISTNGTYLKEPYKKLPKEVAIKINLKDIFIVGDYEIEVKSIENSVVNQNSLSHNYLASNEKSIDDFVIPDDDFLLNDESIMNSSFIKKDSTNLFKNNLLVEKSKSLTFLDEEYEEINSENLLYQHVNLPKYKPILDDEIIYEVQETKKTALNSVVEYSLLNILENKLGINFQKLNVIEQEKVLAQIAEIVILSLEGLKTSMNIKNKVLKDLKIGEMSNKEENPINKGKEILLNVVDLSNHKLDVIEVVKKTFSELDNHNIALYQANKNLFPKVFEKLSPANLEIEAKKSFDFSILRSRKSQMWDIYTDIYHNFSKENFFISSDFHRNFSEEYNKTIFDVNLTSI